jgi:uracil-DNA glycosylase
MKESSNQLGLELDYHVDDKTKNLIGESWTKALGNIVSNGFLDTIRKNLKEELDQNHIVYPSMDKLFRAFQETSFDDLKVIIVGQDPYYNGSANGLAFASDFLWCPASLKVMLKSAKSSLLEGKDFTLTQWTKQGVFLYNCQLTVRKDEANSHQYMGWHTLARRVFKVLNKEKSGIVFVLLGAMPRSFKHLLTNPKNLVIEVEHPAASLYDKRDWEGTDVFEEINDFLESNNQTKIIF